jgi:hypothetical protein
MTQSCGGGDRNMMDDSTQLVASHPAEWLSFAATPTFALMAILTAIPDGGAHQMSCAGAIHAAALGGMVPMYALMSAFHCMPWLKLVARARRAAATV